MLKERKGTLKECVSTSATADLHMYFLLRSAIKFTFLQEKTRTHALKKTNVRICQPTNYIPRCRQHDLRGVLRLSSCHRPRKWRRGGLDPQRKDAADGSCVTSPNWRNMEEEEDLDEKFMGRNYGKRRISFYSRG